MTSLHWQQLLESRGILGAALDAGWTLAPTGDGWQYPLFNADGTASGHHRFKALDSTARMKYSWPDGKGNVKYYLLPGADEAIANCHALIIASGEPDVLTLRSAMASNALCWFGEGAIPASLVADLAELGVNRVELYPDRDEVGLDSARAIVARLRDTGIDVRVYELPKPLGSKYDLNKVWIDCQFNQRKFWDVLEGCPELHFEAIDDVSPLPLLDSTERGDFPVSFIAAIEQALHVTSYKGEWSKSVICPFHDDTNPSGAWNHKKQIFKCMVCMGAEGEYKLATEVGTQLGINVRDYTETKRAPVVPPVSVQNAPRKTPVGKPKVLYTWKEASEAAMASIFSDMGTYEALPIFSRNIALFGGISKLVPPKKMVAILADSGHGKTSMLETQIDFLRQNGYHGVGWSPEWSKEELVFRSIQRLGGPTLSDIIAHNTYKTQRARGVTDNHNVGKLMTDEQLAALQYYNDIILKWPGDFDIIDHAGVDVSGLNASIELSIDDHAAQGKPIHYAVVDYIQMLDAEGNSDHEKNKQALAFLKQLTVDRNLVTFVGSQITKEAGRGSSGGGKIDQHAGQNLRGDVFNLLISLKRDIDTDGNFEPTAEVRISKNSLGRNGTTKLYQKPGTSQWFDTDTRPLNI